MTQVVDDGLDESRSHITANYLWSWIGDSDVAVSNTDSTLQGTVHDATGFAEADWTTTDNAEDRQAEVTVTHDGADFASGGVSVNEAGLFDSDQGGSENMYGRGVFDTTASMTVDDQLDLTWTLKFQTTAT